MRDVRIYYSCGIEKVLYSVGVFIYFSTVALGEGVSKVGAWWWRHQYYFIMIVINNYHE